MKFTWGTGIAIFLSCFIIFILSFIVRASMLQTELYSEDYYQQEIDYQTTIDSKSNGKEYAEEFYLSMGDKQIVVHVPNIDWANCENAKLVFYRSNDSKLDQVLTITDQTADIIRLAKDDFELGAYEMKLGWELNGENFLIQQEIIIE
jgi:hypothetical protein